MNYYCCFIKNGEEETFKAEAQKTVSEIAPECQFHFVKTEFWEGKACKGRKIIVPVFPGYVFFSVNELTKDIIGRLKKIKGFLRVLPSDDNIQSIKGAEADALRSFFGTGEFHRMSVAEYDENDHVRILSGDLKIFEGYVVHVDRRRQFITVQLPEKMLSMEIRLSYELTIEKI